MSRPLVSTTVNLADTGWSDASTGGTVVTDAIDVIPTMSAATTNGVTITASSQNTFVTTDGANQSAWKIADDNTATVWTDTGYFEDTGLPSWLNVDFGAGDPKTIRSYSVRSGPNAGGLDNAPSAWRLIGSNYDTGTYATDTGKWALEDERTGITSWSVSERKSYALTDTGTPDAWRHWRMYVTDIVGGGDESNELQISELELFEAAPSAQVTFNGQKLVLNATSIGALARVRKHVVVDTGDQEIEHSLAIRVSRGPVTLRVGSSVGDDDYISETTLGTGYHNLAFTPSTDFYISLQSDADVNRIVESLAIGDSGTVEITTPWNAAVLDFIRYDQSADVVYVDNEFVKPHKIERRGTGRSWSVVEYNPNNGPFLQGNSRHIEWREAA